MKNVFFFDILTFISRINGTSEILKHKKSFFSKFYKPVKKKVL